MTPSFLTAPEAYCDTSLRGLRAGRTGHVRRPIQAAHDLRGERSYGAPRVFLAGLVLPPAHLSAARFGRALSIPAERQSAKIIRSAINEHSKSPNHVAKATGSEICSGEEISCKG